MVVWQVLVALVGEWYLDHAEHDWWSAYKLEPCEGLATPESCALIVGGETCMWTENVDPSNIIARIWPRAAAVAGTPVIRPHTPIECAMPVLESRV